jgi:hypothetical protein
VIADVYVAHQASSTRIGNRGGQELLEFAEHLNPKVPRAEQPRERGSIRPVVIDEVDDDVS